MKVKRDLKSKKDIERMVNKFYKKVKKDDLLGIYFKNTNWDKHLPIMYSFWENIAFSSSDYSGNPMEKHQYLHQQNPIANIHFDRWMEIYTLNMNELFEGPNANILILRASNISKIMISKLIK